MNGESPGLRCVAVVLFVAVGAGLSIVWIAVEDPGLHTFDGDDSFGERPDREVTVTCYKWTENGSAHVICPDTVYAPDSVVNITVKHCDEYEYAVDEPHPCYGGLEANETAQLTEN